MDGYALTIAVVGTIAIGSILLLSRLRQGAYSGRELSRILTEDLTEDGSNAEPGAGRVSRRTARKRRSEPVHNFDLAGLSSADEQQSFLAQRRLTLAAGLAVGCLLWLIVGKFDPARAVAFIGGGYFIGYFFASRRYAARCKQYVRDLEFYLPIVMERLVMAVHAGLDVLAAIRAVIEHEKYGDGALSPVSRLLEQVLKCTESGLTFDDALTLVGEKAPCAAVRHAFLHLGAAYREGGELVMPLRELSDATQLYFQESLEEEVARMPVKATVPLVITFAGLILIFVAMPLVQVMSMMKRSMPETSHVVR